MAGQLAQKIRVMVADDHFLVRAGLKELVEQDDGLEVVAQAGGGADTLEYLHSAAPIDVLLMDLLMPPPNGPELVAAVLNLRPHLPILIVSMHDDTEFIDAAVKAGARGFVTKNVPPRNLRAAIRQLSAGGTWFDGFYPAAENNRLAGPAVELSDRESQVLALIARGLRNSEIARMLFISEKTVSTHKSNLLKKLNLNTTADLIRYADHSLNPDRAGR